MMKTLIHCRMIILLILTLPTLNSFTDDSLQKSFEKCAKSRGFEYEKLRDHLASKGEAIRPTLITKLKSKDLHERLLAEAILFYLDDPQKVHEWKLHCNNKKRQSTKQLFNEVDLSSNTDLSFSSSVILTSLDLDYLQTLKTIKFIPDCIKADLLWEGYYGYIPSLHFAISPNQDIAKIFWEEVDGRGNDHGLLCREGLLKLGDHPRYLQTIKEVLSLLERLETDKKFKFSEAFWKIDMKFRISLYVLSRLKSEEANALMLQILYHKNNYTIYREDELPDTQNIESMVKCWYRGQRVRITPILEALSYNGLEQNLPHLVHFLLICGKTNRKTAIYWKVRHWIVKNYGEQALPQLQELRESYPKGYQKTLISALMAEIDGQDTKENSLVKLREATILQPTVERLLELHNRTGEDVVSRLINLYSSPRHEHDTKKIKALREIGNPEAIPYLLQTVSGAHIKHIRFTAKKLNLYPFPDKNFQQQWQLCIEKSTKLGYTGLLDARGVRIAEYEEVTKDIALADQAIYAIADIGGAPAIEALKKIIDYPAFTVQAESMLLAVNKNTSLLKERLKSSKIGVSEEAAMALAKLNNPIGTTHLLRATARRVQTRFGNSQFEGWKECALSAKNLKESLIEMSESDNIREKILAKYMLIELQEPDKAKMYQDTLYRKAGFISSWHVWGADKVKANGEAWVRTDGTMTPVKRVIQYRSKNKSTLPSFDFPATEEPPDSRLDTTFVPLLQYSIIFDDDYLRRAVAAFALAKLDKSSAIPAIVESFNSWVIRRPSMQAMALLQCGKDGTEAASKVALPNPDAWDAKHKIPVNVDAVYVMSLSKDNRAVEHIVKGLETILKNSDSYWWEYDLNEYLKAAALYHDDRLVKPLNEFMKLPKKTYMKGKIIPILAKYKTAEPASTYLQQLGTCKLIKTRDKARKLNLYEAPLPFIWYSSSFSPAADATIKIKKDKTFEYLKSEYEVTDNIELKCGILLAMARLSYPLNTNAELKKSKNENSSVSKREAMRLASEMREKSFPFLCQRLTDKNGSIATTASLALARWGGGIECKHPTFFYKKSRKNGDRRAVDLLNNWVEEKGKENTGYSIVEYLAYWGNKRSGELILKLYKEGYYPKSTVSCLEVIQPAGAVELLSEQLLNNNRYVRVDNLKYMGDDGVRALIKILKQPKATNSRKIHIASRLIETRRGWFGKEPKYELPVELYNDEIVPAVTNAVIELIDSGKKEVQYADTPMEPEEERRSYRLTIESFAKSVEKASPVEAKKIAQHILKTEYPVAMIPWANKIQKNIHIQTP